MQDDDVSNDAGRTSNKSWTDEKSDKRPTKVGRVELSRHCSDGERRRYTATPRNAAAMAGSVATRSVVAALACNILAALLQQRAGRCNVAAMANNALDFATLLR
jgi:hypothetical protein